MRPRTPDGFLEEHVASSNPQSNVLNAKNSFVYNRHKKGREGIVGGA